jgi:antitoxin SocA-like protein
MRFVTREDPGIRDLTTYVVARALGREASVTRTKLVKLLYLIDIEQQRRAGRPLTGLRWVFYHFGPYSFDLRDELDAMEGSRLTTRELVASSDRELAILYVGVIDPPQEDLWPEMTRTRIDRVVDKWALEPLNLLLDHVYFHTAPMRSARRGEQLDLSSASEEESVLPYRPLQAPALRDENATARLGAWVDAFRAHFLNVELDPPPGIENGVGERDTPIAAEEDVAEGRLEVPSDVDL